jgi:hypothetical protein
MSEFVTLEFLCVLIQMLEFIPDASEILMVYTS